ncbi:hypothetical protein AB0O64_23610 [Streptomyces sp. NPDC088341]|uniref:hypothetical protein n=1 Tax=Streptomyces sp. NPDC088341 TaxID=3154870 RepID=UPI00343BA31C
MRPVVGASVHYVSRDTSDGEITLRCSEATITVVHPSRGAGTLADLRGPEEADLAVLEPSGVTGVEKSPHSEGTRRHGTWHWPDEV